MGQTESSAECSYSRSFLLGFKRLLDQGEFERKVIKVDVDDMTLQIDGQLVCTVYIMDGKLHII